MSTEVCTTQVSRKLNFEDVLCPICRTIFIKPVSLPCRHTVCKQCLEKTVENNPLVCPICRKRIASFLRSSKNTENLINQNFWREMKEQFPTEIKLKQNGEEDGICEKVFGNQKPLPQVSCTKGSIKEEFDQLIEKLKLQQEQSRLAEEAASEKLAQQILAEEIKMEHDRRLSQQKIAQADVIFIRNLMLAEKSQPGTSLEESDNTAEPQNDTTCCSHGRDSITAELRHFTPICIMPKTPPKRLPNGKVQETKLVKPVNLAANLEETPDSPVPNQSSLHRSSLTVYSNNFVRTRSEEEAASAVISPESTSTDCKEDGSLIRVNGILTTDLIKNQEMLQARIVQERKDLALALRLHAKWNSKPKVPSKRNHGYMLRSAKSRRLL